MVLTYNRGVGLRGQELRAVLSGARKGIFEREAEHRRSRRRRLLGIIGRHCTCGGWRFLRSGTPHKRHEQGSHRGPRQNEGAKRFHKCSTPGPDENRCAAGRSYGNETKLNTGLTASCRGKRLRREVRCKGASGRVGMRRSEEHTSELQSRFDLVCRLLLEKKKKKI